MNNKSTNRPAGKPTSRPETRGGASATTKGKTLRPNEKPPKPAMYGVYREAAPAKTPPPPAGRAPAASALAEALRAVTAEVNALKKDVAQKDTEIKALQKRLTQMEARQKAQEKAFRAQQIPAGMTPMQAIMGHLDVEETTKEMLAQLKALDE
jgi:hypothetical protein